MATRAVFPKLAQKLEQVWPDEFQILEKIFAREHKYWRMLYIEFQTLVKFAGIQKTWQVLHFLFVLHIVNSKILQILPNSSNLKSSLKINKRDRTM